MKRTVGILGGMGPLATCDLYEKITRATPAASDQDHLHVLIDSNTDIPDRTAAILRGGPDPTPQLCRSARTLLAAGAGVLCMPCNTAHFFYDRVLACARAERPDVRFLHMPRETARRAAALGVRTAGLLATDGTVRSGVYAEACAAAGIRLVTPDEAGQRAVMALIYDGVKAGNWDLDLAPFRAALRDLRARGAETLLLGCTELPVAFARFAFDVPTLDPTEILAQAVVRTALEAEESGENETFSWKMPKMC